MKLKDVHSITFSDALGTANVVVNTQIGNVVIQDRPDTYAKYVSIKIGDIPDLIKALRLAQKIWKD